MARKKEPAYETEKYTFPSRLRGLMEARGTRQKELAEAIGMRPQTVSLYVQGQSFPDVNGLEKIARFFSVSADYLLGLSETETVEADIQVVCKVTGLSEKAIQLLHSLDSGNLGVHVKGYDVPHLYVINGMLESKAVLNLFNSLADFLIYGGVLPRDAYENDEPELTLDEYERFYRWANRRGLEIEDRKNIREMHLQKACDELKSIFRDILEREIKNNGQH